MNMSSPSTHPESLCDTTPDSQDVFRKSPSTVKVADGDPAPARRSVRVLCIDDDEMILESVKDFLAFFGHEVEGAAGGLRGLEMFRAAILKGDPYEVVITDLNMPDLNGYMVAETIKARSPQTPVILMTGAANPAMDGGPSSTSVDVVVNKPACIQELNALLLRMAGPA